MPRAPRYSACLTSRHEQRGCGVRKPAFPATVGNPGGCADQDGVMELGTPTVNGFQEEAMQDLAGSLTVFVYVTHH